MERTKIDASTNLATNKYTNDTSVLTNKYSNDTSKTIADNHDANTLLTTKMNNDTSRETNKLSNDTSKDIAELNNETTLTVNKNNIDATVDSQKRQMVGTALQNAGNTVASLIAAKPQAFAEIDGMDIDEGAKKILKDNLNSAIEEASTHSDTWLNGTPATKEETVTETIPAVTREEPGIYDPNTGTVGPSTTVVVEPAKTVTKVKPASAGTPGFLSTILALFPR